MPRFAPRHRSIKKQEELAKREYEIQQAIQHDFSIEKLIRAAANYTKAKLSYLKAELHVIKEEAFQGVHYSNKKNIESNTEKGEI